MLGSASSYFGHVYWHGGDLSEFRKVCFVVSILSVVSFEFTSFVISRAAPVLEPSIKLPTSGQQSRDAAAAAAAVAATDDDFLGGGRDGTPDSGSAQKRANSDSTAHVRRNLAISPSTEQQLTEAAVVSAVNKKRTIFGFLSQVGRIVFFLQRQQQQQHGKLLGGPG